MTDAKDPKLALFELYLATAEKVSDRRAQANAWMLSVNSATSVIGLSVYGGTIALADALGRVHVLEAEDFLSAEGSAND